MLWNRSEVPSRASDRYIFQNRTTIGRGSRIKTNIRAAITVIRPCLACGSCISMLKTSAIAWMQHLINHEHRKRGFWCALMVLLAVCSLAISVATRYSSSEPSSTYTSRDLHKCSAREAGRQRLTKDGATWFPPLFCSAVLQTPTFYPRFAPAGPPIPGLPFEKSLYNRPPPAEFLV